MTARESKENKEISPGKNNSIEPAPALQMIEYASNNDQ